MSTKVHPFLPRVPVLKDPLHVGPQQLKPNEADSVAGHIIEDKVDVGEPHKRYNSPDYLSSVSTREVAKALLEKVFL